MVRQCACQHKSQDKLHGKGKRVMNPCKIPGVDKPAVKCTVCSKVYPLR